MNPRQFWLGHMLAPSLLTLLAFVLLRVWRLDERLALLFFDGQYWPFKENWWLREFMHTGGHGLALAAFLTLGLLVLGRHWCRHAGASASRGPGLAYGLAAISISVGVIAMGKALLRFPCPWDLVNHPGPFLAYTWLPDAAGCFPSGHASSGYAWLCFYYVACTHYPALRKLAAAIALAVGLCFGAAQQLRGAHFLSHDLVCLYLCWLVASLLYFYWPKPAQNLGPSD